jgi:glycosyltransferase involved in cell wall biosynthesis
VFQDSLSIGEIMVKLPVSIIINNYNYSQFLSEAIESALNQTYPNTEVIVVDDGSTDNSQEIIKSYGTRIIPLLKSNGGQASALNAGFEVSHGEIVIFLDADDYLFPHAAEQVVAAWKPNVANVQYRLELVDARRKFIDTLPCPEIHLDSGNVLPILLKMGRYSCLVTSGNAFNRAALDKIMPIPEEDFRISADGYLVTLIPFYGEIISIEQPLGGYRQHGNNLWSTREGVTNARFIKSIKHNFLKYKFLQERATKLGYEVPQDMGFCDYLHLQDRLTSLRLDPQNHPVPFDSSLILAYKGFFAVWKYSDFSWKRKLILSVWFLWVGLMPQPLVKPAITWWFASESRPKAISVLLKKIRLLTT